MAYSQHASYHEFNIKVGVEALGVEAVGVEVIGVEAVGVEVVGGEVVWVIRPWRN